MKLGMTLTGSMLSRDGMAFAKQAGCTHIVTHLIDYGHHRQDAAFLGGAVGPPLGDCTGVAPWTYEQMAGLVSMLRQEGLEIAALENISPNFWSDILLDGPERARQIEGIKRLIRDAGRAGIPCIGYNFSIAGVWGWQRRPLARGGAQTMAFERQAEHARPLEDGTVWNWRYRPAVPGARPVTVSDEELWQRLTRFLHEVVPVAEEAGVRLAAHPDDPPVERLRGTARLVNQPEKYDRLLAIVDNPANALEFCVGTLQECAGGDIYAATRAAARRKRIAYVHFRNVTGKVPRYHETFIDEGDVDMAEIVRILRDEGYDGVLIPDHAPEMTCAAPWHAGFAFALGYMRALLKNAAELGPSRTAAATES